MQKQDRMKVSLSSGYGSIRIQSTYQPRIQSTVPSGYGLTHLDIRATHGRVDVAFNTDSKIVVMKEDNSLQNIELRKLALMNQPWKVLLFDEKLEDYTFKDMVITHVSYQSQQLTQQHFTALNKSQVSRKAASFIFRKTQTDQDKLRYLDLSQVFPTVCDTQDGSVFDQACVCLKSIQKDKQTYQMGLYCDSFISKNMKQKGKQTTTREVYQLSIENDQRQGPTSSYIVVDDFLVRTAKPKNQYVINEFKKNQLRQRVGVSRVLQLEQRIQDQMRSLFDTFRLLRHQNQQLTAKEGISKLSSTRSTGMFTIRKQDTNGDTTHFASDTLNISLLDTSKGFFLGDSTIQLHCSKGQLSMTINELYKTYQNGLLHDIRIASNEYWLQYSEECELKINEIDERTLAATTVLKLVLSNGKNQVEIKCYAGNQLRVFREKMGRQHSIQVKEIKRILENEPQTYIYLIDSMNRQWKVIRTQSVTQPQPSYQINISIDEKVHPALFIIDNFMQLNKRREKGPIHLVQIGLCGQQTMQLLFLSECKDKAIEDLLMYPEEQGLKRQVVHRSDSCMAQVEMGKLFEGKQSDQQKIQQIVVRYVPQESSSTRQRPSSASSEQSILEDTYCPTYVTSMDFRRQHRLLVLWVDDNPQNNYMQASQIRNYSQPQIAINYDIRSTKALKQWFKCHWPAFKWLSPNSQVVIITDMARVERDEKQGSEKGTKHLNEEAGADLLQMPETQNIPTVIYTNQEIKCIDILRKRKIKRQNCEILRRKDELLSWCVDKYKKAVRRARFL